MLLKFGKPVVHTTLTTAIASVWLINGWFCKVLNWVPRHQLIVARILGEEHAGLTTKIIGALEVLMAAWILSGIRRRWCALTQVAAVAAMNILEFILVPDLLLFGRINAVLATLLMAAILFNETLHQRLQHHKNA